MKALLTLLASYVGAAITVITLMLGWWQRRKRLDVELKIKPEVVVGIHLERVDVRPQLAIIATNPRPHPLVLTKCEIILPDNTAVPVRHRTTLPCELHPNSKHTCEVSYSARILAKTLYAQQRCAMTVKLYGRYYDQSGKAFTSKPFLFDVRQWLGTDAIDT